MKFKGFYDYYHHILRENNDFEVFLDLDGVIVDWVGSTKKVLNIKSLKPFNRAKSDQHTIIDAQGLEFWSEMPWIKDGKQLWNFVKKFKPTILSSPRSYKFAPEGKKIWIKRELGSINVILSNNKSKFAKSNRILIDDYDKNINAWEKRGGIGILHTDTNSTIKKLKEVIEGK